MKKNYTLKPVLLAAFVLAGLSATPSMAQTVTSDVVWDFATANPTSVTPANPNVTISAISQGNNNGTTTLLSTTAPSSGYAGASGTNNAGAAARSGALNTGTSGSAYFEVTLSPVGGVILNSISFGSRSTGTGPQAYSIRTSIDGYNLEAATGTLTANSTWALITTPLFAAALNAPVTLRIYGYNGAGAAVNTANWRIDDVTLNVSASATPLPVTLSSFEAAKLEQGILLQWHTATEKNVSHFEIEQSPDGSRFSFTGKTDALDLPGGSGYSYLDRRAAPGTSYYRLKTVDKDGRYVLSPVVVVAGETAAAQVKPEASLVKDMLPLSFTGKTDDVVLQIVNLSGTTLLRRSAGNTTRLQWDISSLAPGMYLLQARGSQVKESFKFVKQ